jgi:hypothetical protein
MARLRHGFGIQFEPETQSGNAIDLLNVNPIPPGQVAYPEPTPYGYLLGERIDTADQLPESPNTPVALMELGNSMVDRDPTNVEGDSSIPSLYTYFGQFITHDLTLEMARGKELEKVVTPLDAAKIEGLKNVRTPKLDLDSVYGPMIDEAGCFPVPRNGDEFELGKALNCPVGTDLPRKQQKGFPALIGDGRNDETFIISQLHLAFLRAHNALVRQGRKFEEARQLLKHHYQWIVVNDYLQKVADPLVVQGILDGAINVYPMERGPFIPYEFSIAALRFGHSMVRSKYDYSLIEPTASLRRLKVSEAFGRFPGIQRGWIIDWKRFARDGSNKARRIDVAVNNPLPLTRDAEMNLSPTLAALDLLRGYMLRLPTGQAVARHLNLSDDEKLSEENFHSVAVSDEQRGILQNRNITQATPLWFYILAEASHFHQGQHLGPLGSRLVAGVLIGLLRADNDSFIHVPDFHPVIENNGQFGLEDFLRFAEVLN